MKNRKYEDDCVEVFTIVDTFYRPTGNEPTIEKPGLLEEALAQSHERMQVAEKRRKRMDMRIRRMLKNRWQWVYWVIILRIRRYIIEFFHTVDEPEAYIGKWGQFRWLRHHDRKHIHPDDRCTVKRMGNGVYRPIVKCTGVVEKEYIVLNYGDFSLRVKPDRFFVMKPPPFMRGDHVRVLSSRGDTGKEGIIASVCFNSSQNYLYYEVTIDETLSFKWKRNDDLELISRSEDE